MAGCFTESQVLQLLDGRLTPTELQSAEAHLDGCADCRALVAATAAIMPAGVRTPNDGDAGGATAGGAGELPPRVGRYLVRGLVGTGGMSTVYAAFDPQLGRRVALKLLKPDAGHGAGSRARLVREAQAMARLQHANVVTVHDLGVVGDRLYIAMELVDGCTLGAWLRQEPRDWRAVVRTFLAAGRGLAAAHGAGIVHRDFKPENVLVARDGAVRVTDFGVARVTALAAGEPETLPRPADDVEALDTSLTVSGALLGTPVYMAPEQLMGESVDARADVFSFSAALYEALYRQRPFAFRNMGELRAAVCRGQVRTPPPGHGVPEALWRVVERGLAVRPDARFPTMDALLDALEAPLAGRAPRSRRALLAAAALGATTLVALAALYVTRARHAGDWAQPAVAATRRRRARHRRRQGRRARPRARRAPARRARARLRAARGARRGGGARDRRARRRRLRQAVGRRARQGARSPRLPAARRRPRAHAARRARRPHRRCPRRRRRPPAGVGRRRRHARRARRAHRRGERRASATSSPSARPRPTRSAACAPRSPRAPRSPPSYADGLGKLRRFDADGARRALEAVLAADPQQPLAWAALAEAWHQLQYQQRQREAARQAFDRADALPREQRLWVEAQYREAMKEWPQAVELYRSLATFFPDNLDYGLRLADAQLAAGDVAGGQVTLARLATLPPPDGKRSAHRPRPRARAGAHARTAATRCPSSPTRAVARRPRDSGSSSRASASPSARALDSEMHTDDAIAACADAERAFAEAGDRAGVARATLETAALLVRAERYGDADMHIKRALDAYRAVGSEAGVGLAMLNLGIDYKRVGKLPEAKRMIEGAAAQLQELHEPYYAAFARAGSSPPPRPISTSSSRRRSTTARSIELARSIKLDNLTAEALSNFSNLLLRQAHVDEALADAEQSVAIYRRLKTPPDIAYALDRARAARSCSSIACPSRSAPSRRRSSCARRSAGRAAPAGRTSRRWRSPKASWSAPRRWRRRPSTSSTPSTWASPRPTAAPCSPRCSSRRARRRRRRRRSSTPRRW